MIDILSGISTLEGLVDMLSKFSEGNPGAAKILVQLIKRCHEVNTNKNDIPMFIKILLTLDLLEIKGEKIWILFKHVCHQNIDAVIAVLFATTFEAKILPPDILLKAINDGGYNSTLEVESIVKQVEEKFSLFTPKPKEPNVEKQYPEYTNSELATIFGISKRQASQRRMPNSPNPLDPLPEGSPAPTQQNEIAANLEASRKKHFKKKTKKERVEELF